nr:flagellar hook-associated protein FlgK [candidate division Zixibacteria bacterium]
MAGLFEGLELGKRALATHQLWLNTIGHNIANVNTPGYTRQRVTITTTTPSDNPAGPVGTGVQATEILQVRDLFLNQQYRQQNSSLGQWTSLEKTLTQIESLFNEPDGDSLSGLMDDFWNSWSDLANNPESLAARTSLKEQTNLLTSSFHRLYSQLNDLRASVDNDVTLAVENINSISAEIADLNVQISRTELGGDNANDLRDKRDLLIEGLSEYVDVNVSEQKNGTATVYIGSLAIVDGSSSYKIGTYKAGTENATISKVTWAGTTKEIKILNGELSGLIETRDEIIPEYMAALDDMAASLAASVNALHQTGYGLDGSTGISFFDMSDVSASGLSLNSIIENDVNNIAASQSGAIGDNSNALAIADLRNSRFMSRGTATISEFYQGLVGQIGVETGKATTLKENYSLLTSQIDNSRQSVQGVSLDEEMAQMIKFQHAYDAAARIITVMDEALDTVILGMGVVGR